MRIASILCAAILAGCDSCPPAAAPQARVIDTACSWVIPMTAAAADTPETKRQIIAYEATRQKNCPDSKTIR